jgi:signal transduction histidine kinase
MGQTTTLRDLSTLFIGLGLVVVIVAIDWILPAGVAVGILMAVPLLIASASSRSMDVWIVLACAMTGFIVAAIFGEGPVSPARVWVPNRILALMAIPAAGLLARLLQQRRIEAERSRDAAVAAVDTNRLLFSLLAHDLRSPLVLSRQVFDYMQQCISEGRQPDTALLSDVRLRLDRNLRVLDGVLSAARAEVEGSDADIGDSGAVADTIPDLEVEIRQEVDSFAAEADSRGKQFVMSLTGTQRPADAASALVLRQVLAILADNAIRYARPGEVRILARVTQEGMLLLSVSDPGPSSEVSAGSGAGLGLQLCNLLLSRRGGGLRVEKSEESTVVEAWLPLGHAAAGNGA